MHNCVLIILNFFFNYSVLILFISREKTIKYYFLFNYECLFLIFLNPIKLSLKNIQI